MQNKPNEMKWNALNMLNFVQPREAKSKTNCKLDFYGRKKDRMSKKESERAKKGEQAKKQPNRQTNDQIHVNCSIYWRLNYVYTQINRVDLVFTSLISALVVFIWAYVLLDECVFMCVCFRFFFTRCSKIRYVSPVCCVHQFHFVCFWLDRGAFSFLVFSACIHACHIRMHSQVFYL